MNILLITFKLFPVLLAAIQAIEQAIPLPGEGNKKLELILEVLKAAYDGSTELANHFSFEKLAAIVVPMIAKIVALHNALGLFQKSAQPNNV